MGEAGGGSRALGHRRHGARRGKAAAEALLAKRASAGQFQPASGRGNGMSGSGSIWLYLILALNFAISWWNARSCGRAWAESKAVGGSIRFLVWCGAVQSAVGFSSVFLFPLLFAANAFAPDYFTDDQLNGALSLWYLTIIFPVLWTGLIITIESWIAAYRTTV